MERNLMEQELTATIPIKNNSLENISTKQQCFCCPPGTFPYTVKCGDTIWELAKEFNTTVKAIMAVNPGIDPRDLQVGQIICIPKPCCPPGTFPYTIEFCDTIWELAKRFNTTVEAIMAANPSIDPHNLQVGQVICIPKVTPPVPPVPPVPPSHCPPGTFAYTIKCGDTFWLLAKRFNTTADAIIAVNPGVDPRNLQIGQIVCIPKPSMPPVPSETFPYTIKSGDTFWLLAKRFNTTADAIIAVNPGVNPRNLQIGQIVRIPRT
ncbi:MAG: LysM peptidoglycan-binding domain-containing protein [Desulfotomaculum sp.]|nr:LysM peptidoglycan-binding domain-containing protein [Desulfotomaculum sp.]